MQQKINRLIIGFMCVALAATISPHILFAYHTSNGTGNTGAVKEFKKAYKPLQKKVSEASSAQFTLSPVPPSSVQPKPATPKKYAVRRLSLSVASLSVTGIIAATHEARIQNGLRTQLTENPQLMVAAALRMKDMFDKQYFEHDSPTGVKPAEVVKQVGYDYIQFGENIAYGTFKSDKEMVDALMNSALHRENIMKPTFTEIGVAVSKGKLFGQDVWLGVQLFGKSVAACPIIDTALKTKIETDSVQFDAQYENATRLRLEVEAQNPKNNDLITSYNTIVDSYNQIISNLKKIQMRLVADQITYNAQVDAYNACLDDLS